MSEKIVKGSCLCGNVAYEIEGPFKIFQYCHCSRCRKSTGSAHAANLFVPPERFKWTKGEESVAHYKYIDTKYFASSFCENCGSTLPWEVQTGTNVIVAAGTLDEDPGIKPKWNIFWKFRAPWFKETCDLEKYDEYSH